MSDWGRISGSACDQVDAEGEVLDMTARVTEETRETSLDLVKVEV